MQHSLKNPDLKSISHPILFSFFHETTPLIHDIHDIHDILSIFGARLPKGSALELVPGAHAVVQCGLHGLSGCGERSKVELGRWDVGRDGRCRAEFWISLFFSLFFLIKLTREIDGRWVGQGWASQKKWLRMSMIEYGYGYEWKMQVFGWGSTDFRYECGMNIHNCKLLWTWKPAYPGFWFVWIWVKIGLQKIGWFEWTIWPTSFCPWCCIVDPSWGNSFVFPG